MAEYFRPATVNDALALLDRQPCRPLAGGTDVYPAISSASGWALPGQSLRQAAAPATLDLSAVTALRDIHALADRVELGALCTWRDALDAGLPAWFDGVKLAAREVGGAQIQNRATLVGNLCNASPAADGVPPLLALNARLRLQSLAGERELELSEFLLGNRHTARRPDELVTAIVIPKPSPNTRSNFLKLGARRYLVISIAMVALTLSLDERQHIAAAAIAVGACSATAQRLPELEQRLLGQPLAAAASQVDGAPFAALSPIDDARASADYRRHAAQVLVRRGLARLATGTALGQAA